MTWTDEETDDSIVADTRNFYKLEKWTADGLHVDRLLFAGSNLDRAHSLFDGAVRRRPAGRYTIRQRARVLRQWPP